MRHPLLGTERGPGRLATAIITIWSGLVSVVDPSFADPPATDEGAESALAASAVQIAGHAFKTRRTDHFVVAYDASEATARDLARRLEATFDGVIRFCQFNELPVAALQRRLEVYCFARHADFEAYARSLGTSAGAWSGFYYTGNNRAAFFDALDDPDLRPLLDNMADLQRNIERLNGDARQRSAHRRELERNRQELRKLERLRNDHVERLNRLVVQHEAAHHILYNIGIHVIGSQNPHWLTEGLACLFETPPGEDGAGAVAINRMRLRDFRTACVGQNPGGRLTPDQVARAIKLGRFAPLRELIGNATILLDRDNKNLIDYYAQSWSMVCYLQRTRREAFAEYLRALAQRPAGRQYDRDEAVADFERAFGPLDDAFQKRWAAYVAGLDFKSGDIP